MIQAFSLFFSLFFLDWATKAVVRAKLTLGEEIPVTPFFSWVRVENTGVAFGLFPDKNLVFVVLGVVLTVMMFLVRRLLQEDRMGALIMAAVLGGAWGNLFDRLRFGAVTDFLDFYVGTHHWPAFNVADSTICVGAALLIFKNVRR